MTAVLVYARQPLSRFIPCCEGSCDSCGSTYLTVPSRLERTVHFLLRISADIAVGVAIAVWVQIGVVGGCAALLLRVEIGHVGVWRVIACSLSYRVRGTIGALGGMEGSSNTQFCSKKPLKNTCGGEVGGRWTVVKEAEKVLRCCQIAAVRQRFPDILECLAQS